MLDEIKLTIMDRIFIALFRKGKNARAFRINPFANLIVTDHKKSGTAFIIKFHNTGVTVHLDISREEVTGIQNKMEEIMEGCRS